MASKMSAKLEGIHYLTMELSTKKLLINRLLEFHSKAITLTVVSIFKIE